jgi:hypothetical protein
MAPFTLLFCSFLHRRDVKKSKIGVRLSSNRAPVASATRAPGKAPALNQGTTAAEWID